MNQKFWRMQTTSPYFDSRLSWYPNVWAYNELYGTWVGNNPIVSAHPDWVLKDQYGNWLYLPFACNGSTCSQYALDPGNPAVRNWWISNVAGQMSKGYKGIWIDDVNLDWRTGDGSGTTVIPMDPRTGQVMTNSAWQSYIVGFVQAIRNAFPNKEIVHNSLWFAGGSQRDNNPYVIQEIQAADFINLERGVDDSGLTGGTGIWSVNALLSFVDHVHSLGKKIVFDEYGFYGDYQTAAYFLVSTGGDGLGNQAVTPNIWWSGYDVQLGSPLGGRYAWNGLLRRDFQNGMVLLNVPNAPQVTVTLPGSYQRDDGSIASTVTLVGKQGAVLIGATSSANTGSGLLNGTYTITNQSSGLVLDDPAFSTSSGQQMIQWRSTGGSDQRWQFTSNGSGYYTIQNEASSLYLTSPSSSGSGLQQQSKNGGDSQLWSLKSSGTGSSIQNKATGLAIDDPTFSSAPGTGIIVWGSNGGTNQTWTIQ
jgi:Ricin-type beta-trefoil lectin domain-like/Hypothetical glycosyl hydrolase family 15